MKKIYRLLKVPAFFILLMTILVMTNRILTIKGKETTYYNSVSEYGGFYQMNRDSIDVLFLGSSHCYCGFSPQEFYNDYKIRSYNLGSSQQSTWISYFWLKEALKYQHPNTVVLETLYLLQGDGDESSMQKALSYMKWSNVKKEAIEVACEEYTNISPISFYFQNIKFHERWKELDEYDFNYDKLMETKDFKGYSPMGKKYNEEGYNLLTLNTEEKSYILEISLKIMDKIVELCRNKNINLILVKTPAINWSNENHNTIVDYANQNELTFYDFNTKELYAEIDYELFEDNVDGGHANRYGIIDIGNYRS